MTYTNYNFGLWDNIKSAGSRAINGYSWTQGGKNIGLRAGEGGLIGGALGAAGGNIAGRIKRNQMARAARDAASTGIGNKILNAINGNRLKNIENIARSRVSLAKHTLAGAGIGAGIGAGVGAGAGALENATKKGKFYEGRHDEDVKRYDKLKNKYDKRGQTLAEINAEAEGHLKRAKYAENRASAAEDRVKSAEKEAEKARKRVEAAERKVGYYKEISKGPIAVTKKGIGKVIKSLGDAWQKHKEKKKEKEANSYGAADFYDTFGGNAARLSYGQHSLKNHMTARGYQYFSNSFLSDMKESIQKKRDQRFRDDYTKLKSQLKALKHSPELKRTLKAIKRIPGVKQATSDWKQSPNYANDKKILKNSKKVLKKGLKQLDNYILSK